MIMLSNVYGQIPNVLQKDIEAVEKKTDDIRNLRLEL